MSRALLCNSVSGGNDACLPAVSAARQAVAELPQVDRRLTGDAPPRCAAAPRSLHLHDDAERETAYTGGAEQALEQAASDGWTVITINNDWEAMF